MFESFLLFPVTHRYRLPHIPHTAYLVLPLFGIAFQKLYVKTVEWSHQVLIWHIDLNSQLSHDFAI